LLLRPLRPPGWLRWLTRFVLYVGASFAIFFFLLMLAVRLVVVPRIGDYRDEITALIARGVGQKVSISEIEAGWDGWSPTLTLSEFKLFDQNGNAALTLPKVETSVSWRSVLIGEIRLRRLEVTGAQLLVRRDAQGHLHVGGMDVEPTAEPEDSGATEWFIKQRQVEIRDGTVVWQDELRQAAPLRLDRVNLLLENSGRRHRFGLTAVPPVALASPLDVRGDITLPSVKEMHSARGRVYTRLDYADMAAWKAWVPLPFELKSGQGALRGWIDFAEGAVSDVTLDLELDDFRTRLKANLPELDLAHLAGRLAWRQQAERTDLSTRGLELTTKGGVKLTPGDISVRLAAPLSGKPANGEIRSSHLQLEPIFALVQYLPFDDKLRTRLGKFAPVGVLETASFTWTGELEAPADYGLRAQFTGLGVSAVDAFPGLTRLSGSIDANARAGALNFTADGTRLTLPRVFAAPLDFDNVVLQASWKVSDQVAVKIGKLTFANADTAGSAQGDYKTMDKGPGWMDLTGTISRAKAPAIYKYIPLTIGAAVRAWLRDALLNGSASDARFTVRGNLYDFPFAENKGGLFQIAAKVSNATLDYADHWPTIENVKADLMFEGARMVVSASEATSVGIKLNKVHVEIPELGAEHSRLVIQGEGGGSTEGFLQYIDQSPVGNWIDHFTQGARATGTGTLALNLDIPLGKYEDARINGEYAFSGNTMQLGPEVPRLDKAGGKFVFTEREFRAQNVTADLLGGPASIQVAVADGKVHVGMAGNADMTEVRRNYPFPLAERMRGRADWQFALQSEAGVYGWTVDSTLRGITVDLPAPLAKKPEQSLPLRLERQAIDRTHDRMSATFGTIGQLEAVRLLSDKAAEVQRLAFSFGRTPARADRDGFWIRGNVDHVDLDPWLALAGGAGSGDQVNKAALAAGNAGPPDMTLAGVDLRAETMLAFGRKLHNLNVQARNQAGEWRIDLDSDETAGSAVWQPPKANDTGKLSARLRRLALASESASAGAMPPAPSGPPVTSAALRRDLPALDVISESYMSRGHDLGRLELQARPEGTDWRIDTLALRNPESDLVAKGRWRVQGALQRTEMDVKLEVRDAGKFLARHGVPEGAKGGNGSLEGQLNWVGGPQDFDYPTLNGKFSVDVKRGQFTKVDPGIGKLLGILNLEALARRLTLDFRDVMAEGYSFDEMSGDVALRNGVMTTSNLRIVGPAAKVEISGEADIAKETQRLKIRVQPSLTGGLAAAAAAATVNPIVGAGVLLGSTILRDPIGKLFAGEYEVTGTWVEPRVETIAGAKSAAPAANNGSLQ
jgi:uncharacterized protein (TIGR02099 family)